MEPSPELVTCLDWAKEGEKAIRAGRIPQGIASLEQALEAKTDDVALLSAIYSQLGNAHYSTANFEKARSYHINDFNLARMMRDAEGQAKAAGNVGNAYKAQGYYNEAAKFTEVQLKIARTIGDKKLETSALFHLGTILFNKGKQEGKQLRATIGNLSTSCLRISDLHLRAPESQSMKEDVEEAVEYFKQCLDVYIAAGDRAAEGRIYGSLGNAYYLLRDFETTVDYHQKRLEVARQFGDKQTQKKVYMNLGNTHVMMSQIERAIEYYRLALMLAEELRDQIGQAHSSFSLATAASLTQDYNTAAQYHTRHLTLARKLKDTAGTARGLSSLGDVFRHIGDYQKAAYFFARTRSMAKEMHDPRTQEAAEASLRDLIEEVGDAVMQNGEILLDSSADPDGASLPPLRLSLSLDGLRDFEDCGLRRTDVFQSDTELSARPSAKMSQGQEDFFDMISRLQSKRMDEQRCDARILDDISNKKPRHRDTQLPSPAASVSSRDSNKRRLSLFGRVTSTILRDSRPLMTSTPVKSTTSLFPSLRLKGRNASLSSLTSINSEPVGHEREEKEPVFRVPALPHRPPAPSAEDLRRHSMFAGQLAEKPPVPPRRKKKDGPEALIEQLMQAQGRRMDEQRADLLPGLQGGPDLLNKLQGASELEGAFDEQLLEMVARAQGQRMNEQRSELGGRAKEGDERKPDHAPTIPEDDLSDLVARMQKGRLEEQRAHLADAAKEEASN